MKYCSECVYCDQPDRLVVLVKNGSTKSFKKIKCRFIYDMPLVPNLHYFPTCWNARKHEGLCGIKGEKWRRK